MNKPIFWIIGAVLVVGAAAFFGASGELRPVPKDPAARAKELYRRAEEAEPRCLTWIQEWEKLVGPAAPEAARFRRLQEHLREYPGISRWTKEGWKGSAGSSFPDCQYGRLLESAAKVLSEENRKATVGQKNVGPLAEVLAHSLLFMVRDQFQPDVPASTLAPSIAFVGHLGKAGWLDWTSADLKAWDAAAGNVGTYKIILDRTKVHAAAK